MKTLSLLLATLAALACSPVDLPRGTAKNYGSARLLDGNERPIPGFAERTPEINRVIRAELDRQLEANGIATGAADAELVVGYLLLLQDGISTVAIDDYFGYGRDSEAILDAAQLEGVVKHPRPDGGTRGAIVVDIMDARTNKLVFRNYAVRDASPAGTPATTRNQRLRQAVAEAVAPFFR